MNQPTLDEPIELDDTSISDDDVRTFLTRLFTGLPFEKAYTYESGLFHVGFRTLLRSEAKEIDDTLKDLKHGPVEKYKEERDYQRLLRSVTYIVVDSRTIYDKARDQIDTLISLLESEPVTYILRILYRKFETLCADIIKLVTSKDFFDEAKVATDL